MRFISSLVRKLALLTQTKWNSLRQLLFYEAPLKSNMNISGEDVRDYPELPALLSAVEDICAGQCRERSREILLRYFFDFDDNTIFVSDTEENTLIVSRLQTLMPLASQARVEAAGVVESHVTSVWGYHHYSDLAVYQSAAIAHFTDKLRTSPYGARLHAAATR